MSEGSEGRSFWNDSERPGRDDAELLLAEQVHALRYTPYEELRRRAGEGTRVEDVETLSGTTMARRTKVTARDGELQVLVQVDDGTPSGRLDPLAEELVVVGPEGDMVGEYTLAPEANDPRRYAPSSWLPLAVLAAVAVLAAIALLVVLLG